MIGVMIAGLPGRMASLVANAVEEDPGLQLIRQAFANTATGLWKLERDRTVGSIALIPSEEHEEFIRRIEPDIIVDFTKPDAVNRNAALYCKCGTSFVMGTTGGDRRELYDTVINSDVSAVIAPNMAPQIVALDAMMAFVANKCPDLFEAYTLEIVESHQAGKLDTSGTAKVMVEHFNLLGIPFAKEQIVMIRDANVQKYVLGVPEEHLPGHAWHTYRLLSPDRTVLLQFTHNVNGRTIYIPGVIAAIKFLADQGTSGGVVYSMGEVLGLS